MSAEASQRTLGEFGTDVETTPEKTYTATNVRNWSGDKRVGTVRRDWLAAMLRKFADACDVYHTGMSPYRYEPQHAQQDSRINDYSEEHDTPGIPVDDVEDFAGTVACHDHYDARVTLGDGGVEDGRQVITVSGATKDYEVHVDASVVMWQE